MTKKAETHQWKAANFQSALEHTVFSDDENAIQALEQRIADREQELDRMKLVNKMYRTKDAEGLKAIGLTLERLQADCAKLGNYFGQAPYMPFSLTNLGARIRADKKRLESIKHIQRRAQEAAHAPNGVIIKRGLAGAAKYAYIVFAEKPDYSIIRDLKSADFRWGAGRWFGEFEKIPASVISLVREGEQANTSQPGL